MLPVRWHAKYIQTGILASCHHGSCNSSENCISREKVVKILLQIKNMCPFPAPPHPSKKRRSSCPSLRCGLIETTTSNVGQGPRRGQIKELQYILNIYKYRKYRCNRTASSKNTISDDSVLFAYLYSLDGCISSQHAHLAFHAQGHFTMNRVSL